METKLPYEEAAEYLTDIKGWVCKTCKNYYGTGENAEHYARYCCSEDIPCKCGKGRAKKGWCVCKTCQDHNHMKMIDDNFDKAELVEYDGPFFVDDDFYNNIDEYLDYCYDNDELAYHFAFVPEFKPMKLDYEDLMIGLSEDHAEDVEPIEVSSLIEAIKEFNQANEKNVTYYVSYKKKFKVWEDVT